MEGKIKMGCMTIKSHLVCHSLTLYYCISVVLWQGRRYNNDDDDDDDEDDDKDNNQ